MTAPGDNNDTQARTPETTDRLMVGACGAIWLVFLVVSAIAVVALTNLGRGHSAAEDGGSPWLLYTVIAVSALTIVGAIPLLLKARRTALESKAGSEADAVQSAPPVAITARAGEPVREAATEKMRVFGTSVDPSARRQAAEDAATPANAGMLERLWLRGTTSLLGAMGLALTGVSTATYLLAAGSDTGAWVALGVAGVITVAMPAVLVYFNRQLAEAARAE